MRELTRIGLVSSMKVSGIVYGFMGFVGGLFLTGAFLLSGEDVNGISSFVSLTAPVTVALFYGILGAISSAIFCGVYNIIAKYFGGIEYEIAIKEGKS